MRTRVDAFGAIVPPAGSIKFGPGQIHYLPGGGQIHFYPGGGGHFWPGPGGYNPNPQPQPVPVSPPSFQQQLSQLVTNIYRAWDAGVLYDGSSTAVISQFQQTYNAWNNAGRPGTNTFLRHPHHLQPLSVTGSYDDDTSSAVSDVINSFGMDQGQSAISAPPGNGVEFSRDSVG